jgi:hypothetical protein
LDKGVLYRLLNNRVYIGEAVHKGTSYPGEHEAIIDRDLWDQATPFSRKVPASVPGTLERRLPLLSKASCSALTARRCRQPTPGEAASSIATTSSRLR